MKLFLDKFWTNSPGSSVLHFAPERPIYSHLKSLNVQKYRGLDISPENFKFAPIERFDLCHDVSSLPSNEYDLIIHSHVMEHIPCNITAVLAHVHRSLRPDGLHLLCVPIMSGRYAEDFTPLSEEYASEKFGQKDHVRRFGRDDFGMTLGMVFSIPKLYKMENYISSKFLDAHNIPPKDRTGYTGTSIIPLRKSDYLL